MFRSTEPSRGGGSGLLTGLLAGATTIGAAWLLDSRRRDAETARTHRALVDLLLNALNAGDPVTERHSRRVADLTESLADTFGIRRGHRSTLRLAALLHDMGKIDDRFFHILHKCEPLTDDERRAIKQHPRESADILQPLEPLHPGISAIVAAHHESWDGKGYPQGLGGEDIPLESRIISVADVFDALTQPRAYREPLAIEEALKEIERGAGSRFDPAVVTQLRHPGVLDRWGVIVEEGRADESAARAAQEDGQLPEERKRHKPREGTSKASRKTKGPREGTELRAAGGPARD